MCGGGGSQTVQQKADPWSGVQPYLTGQGSPMGSVAPAAMSGGTRSRGAMERVWDDSRDKYVSRSNPAFQTPQAQDQPYIPGVLPEAARLYQESPTLAPVSPQSYEALNMMEARARAGSDLTRSAQAENLATIRGDYLYGGPGFNAAYQAASNRIIPQVNSAFAGSGRFGSGLAQTAQTQALADSFAGLYGQERSRQQVALGMAPSFAAQDYADIAQLGEVGAQREALAQQQLDEPYMRLGRYQGFINPIMGVGGSSTTTQPLHQNRAASALGGAALGASIPGMFGTAAAGASPALLGMGPAGWALLGAGAMGLLS